MKQVGIVVNLSKPAAATLLPKITEWLSKREIQVRDSTSATVEEIIRQADLVICLGGDGTLLSVAGKMKQRSVPVLGINLGALGFLTEVKQEEVFEELSAFIAGSSTVEERMMLTCSAKSETKKTERRFLVLNDIVISREGLSRMVRLEVKVAGEKLTNYAGDGVIVATPTGSTAYSLSAGGSVVHPKLEAILITPICPHASALRSIVVGAGERISIRLAGASGPTKALLTADGQENIEIDDSFIIEITRASHSLRLVKSSKRSYFATLRENFKFPA